MFKPFRPKTAEKPLPRREAGSCPTAPCRTCQAPMPIVAYDQRCIRCQSLIPAAKACPGACSGCELGEK